MRPEVGPAGADSNGPELRLATYGSLAPGRVNADQLAGLDGEWDQGTLRGHLIDQGWGAGLGFPALVLDPDAPPVPVWVFTSADLPDHWSRLDAFEGSGYRRVSAVVETPEGDRTAAYVYVSA